MKIKTEALVIFCFALGLAFRAFSESAQAPVVIVGAGITGLTTAYQLKKQNINAIILEANSRIGGRVQSVYFENGNYAEGHMEEYFEQSPARALLKELGFRDPESEKVLDPKKLLASDIAHSSVMIDEKIYPYEGEGDKDTYLKGLFNKSEIKTLMNWNDKTLKIYQRLHKSFFDDEDIPLVNPVLPAELIALQKISFKAYVDSFNLPHKVSEWIRITVEAEMAVDWNEVSALDGIDEFRLFLNTKNGWGEKNYHVVGGNSLFIDSLAARLKGQIHTDAKVTAIERKEDGTIKVRYLRAGRRYEEITAQSVVIAVPLFAIHNIQFIPPLSEEKQKAIKSTHFGSYIKVHLTVNQKAEKLWQGEKGERNILTLLTGDIIGAIYDTTSDQKNTSGKTNDESILTALIHTRIANQLFFSNANADEIREYTVKAIDSIFPGIAKHIRSAEIFSYKTAVAYWPLKLERSRFDLLSQQLRKPEGEIYIGSDTTEDSHSEGAIRAALRMFYQIMKSRAEKRLSETNSRTTGEPTLSIARAKRSNPDAMQFRLNCFAALAKAKSNGPQFREHPQKSRLMELDQGDGHKLK